MGSASKSRYCPNGIFTFASQKHMVLWVEKKKAVKAALQPTASVDTSRE
jgi:hypothetical protein